MTRPARRPRRALLGVSLLIIGLVAVIGNAAGLIFTIVAAGGKTPVVSLWSTGGLSAISVLSLTLAAKLSLPQLNRPKSFWVSSLTGLAVLLAGKRRLALGDEWRAHLAGESGHDSVTWHKIRQALGFVEAGIRFRLADAAAVAWRPADAVLSSRTLSNLFVWGPVIVVLVAIVHHDGRFGLVTDLQDPVALGAFLYGVIRTGRWWRGVKPSPPKATRARK